MFNYIIMFAACNEDSHCRTNDVCIDGQCAGNIKHYKDCTYLKYLRNFETSRNMILALIVDFLVSCSNDFDCMSGLVCGVLNYCVLGKLF